MHAQTLQRAFRKHHGTSVMAFVRERRLARVHALLLIGDPGSTTVTDIALASGWWHLGRFSAAYRARFGEDPSQTLRRR